MNHFSNKQSGAVLVMSLVLLTVLTLIGVASMSGSSLEMKAASNAQQRNTAFVAGQSVADVAATMNDPENTIDYQNFVKGVEQTMLYEPVGVGITTTAAALWTDCSKPFGNSLEDGKGLSMNGFRVRVTGKPAVGSATSNQVQGVRFPAASC